MLYFEPQLTDQRINESTMTDNERKVQKRTTEDIAAQAEKIAHLPDVNCECFECTKCAESTKFAESTKCAESMKCLESMKYSEKNHEMKSDNIQKYYENQLTNMYAQLNAQNRMIQEQSQTLMQIIREVVPLMQKIEKQLSQILQENNKL